MIWVTQRFMVRQDTMNQKILKSKTGSACSMKINNRTGEVHRTNEGYEIKIIDYVDRHNVLIKFIHMVDYQVWTTMQNIINGELKNPFHKTVYNIGFYGTGQYSARINNTKTPQYIKWFSMFNRCYDARYQEKNPKYIGCSVSEEFYNFQNFAQWYDKKIYRCNYKLELDKDLLLDSNKVYSPNTCCFLPKEINTSLNCKRHDKEFMTVLYQKYKNEVPYYIRDKLLDLTTYQRK